MNDITAGLGLGKVKPAAQAGQAPARNVDRQPNGQPARTKKAMEARDLSEQSVALGARCRHKGLKVTEANLITCRSEMLESLPGKIISSYCFDLGKGDAVAAHNLWTANKHAASVHQRYNREIGGASPHPKTANIVTEVEPFETAEDDIHLVDERTDEEKLEAARRSYQILMGWLREGVDSRGIFAFKESVFYGRETFDFMGVLYGLMAVSEGLQGAGTKGKEPIVWRGRG